MAGCAELLVSHITDDLFFFLFCKIEMAFLQPTIQRAAYWQCKGSFQITCLDFCVCII